MPIAQTLNPTQIHLLEMFSYCKDAEAFERIGKEHWRTPYSK